MPQANLRFYAELNDFLPNANRQTTISCPLNGPVSAKHLIEALGVPHTEVALILANGESVGFGYLVQEDDRLSMYPAFASIDVSDFLILRPLPPKPARFVLDNHLGQLSTYLRLLGFDALYRNDYDDRELAQISHDDERILLTRDVRLLMRKVIVHGYWLRSKDPRQQLSAVLHRFDVYEEINPWHRCLRCNGELRPVPKKEVMHRLEPKTKKYYDEFHICRDCEQVYWKGSHYGPLQELVLSLGLESGRL
jgi:uncharacterized protein with PIN domain